MANRQVTKQGKCTEAFSRLGLARERQRIVRLEHLVQLGVRGRVEGLATLGARRRGARVIRNLADAFLPPRAAVRFGHSFERRVDVLASSAPSSLAAGTALALPAHRGAISDERTPPRE